MGRGTHGGLGDHRRPRVDSHSLADNLPDVTQKYPLTGGYFGTEGNNKKVRHIESRSPLETAKDFYRRITEGAVSRTKIGEKGEYALMRDGSIITFRRYSSSDGTPASDIKITQRGLVKPHKIHFIKKGLK